MALALKQYYLTCLSHASFLVGHTASGRAVVVDPRRARCICSGSSTFLTSWEALAHGKRSSSWAAEVGV
jgi:hypothetical protein